MDLLKVEHVTKVFANHTALDDVSLTIPEGCVYGLLGPNGAGKTTLIRIINHITAPDTGKVYLNGHELSDNDVYNIGYLPEERGLYKKMKVGEQAIFFARLKGLSRAEASLRLKEWFIKFEISDWWDKKVEELSKGMAQKVQFIITVLHRPKLLIFDEPFSGFDPINANILKKEILQLKAEGSTVIFSTHNMSSVEEICDNITLINKSHNILSGNVNQIKSKYGSNRFTLAYNGDKEKLTAAIADKSSIIGDSTLDNGINNLTIQLTESSQLKDIISIANDAVELKSINEDIPSMNDIFIQTVNNYNKENNL
ncbi:MAG: ATP-binding cassette domain-containing protein [Muribaculaceae bacterium]|nr:ATP-binding cassette domain-containing protein [Muribaculaceae bacterium]